MPQRFRLRDGTVLDGGHDLKQVRRRKTESPAGSDRQANHDVYCRRADQLDDLAIAALKKELIDNPSPEARQRIRTILKNAESWRSPGRLRQLRALEVLEKIGTPPARQVLQKLAAGASAARLTREAAMAVSRLGKGN